MSRFLLLSLHFTLQDHKRTIARLGGGRRHKHRINDVHHAVRGSDVGRSDLRFTVDHHNQRSRCTLHGIHRVTQDPPLRPRLVSGGLALSVIQRLLQPRVERRILGHDVVV